MEAKDFQTEKTNNCRTAQTPRPNLRFLCGLLFKPSSLPSVKVGIGSPKSSAPKTHSAGPVLATLKTSYPNSSFPLRPSVQTLFASFCKSRNRFTQFIGP